MLKTLLRQISAPLLAALYLLACGSSEQAAVEKAEKEVFAIHDEVMPRIDEIMRLRKQLRDRTAQLDTLSAGGSAERARLDEQRAQATQLIAQLTEADSLMMNWMEQYKTDTLRTLPAEQALQYLEAEKEKITDVKAKINRSTGAAKAFLQQ